MIARPSSWHVHGVQSLPDPRRWNLFLPLCLTAACGTPGAGPGTESGDASTSTSTTTTEGSSTSEGSEGESSGSEDGSETGGDGDCFDNYTGADTCPDGFFCADDAGNCDATPTLPDCAATPVAPPVAIPITGALALHPGAGSDRLWVGEANGALHRVDDVASGTSTQLHDFEAPIAALAFADAVGDGAIDLLVGVRDLPDDPDGATFVLERSGDAWLPPVQLWDRTMEGLWEADFDGDTEAEFMVSLATGEAYDDLGWLPAPTKPLPLPEVILPYEVFRDGHGAIADLDEDGRPDLVYERGCMLECSVAPDYFVHVADGATAPETDPTEPWPAFPTLQLPMPMQSGPDLLGVARSIGRTFYAQTRPGDSGLSPTWASPPREIPDSYGSAGATLDFDDDGTRDFVVNAQGGVKLVIRDADGLAGCISTLELPISPELILAGDLTQDGRDDIIAADGPGATAPMLYIIDPSASP